MKYNLDDLHWQQFEILSFYCLQKDVSVSIEFLEGGNDKGRDIVYEGTSEKFNPSWNGKWIFQIKHKSHLETNSSRLSSALVSDFKTELIKICLQTCVDFDNYILVTNLNITSSLHDSLHNAFKAFCKEHNILNKNFKIYGYRHFETCIDSNNAIKWSFQSILNQPDLQTLLLTLQNSKIETRNVGWFNSVEKYRKYFVYTNFYLQAYSKLQTYHTILLSGPAKSGKTFTADNLIYNYIGEYGFSPFKIDTPDEIEQFFRAESKQLFFCDDAFGSHRLSYTNADDWNRKIEGILSLANDTHKFIFTSREHVYNAFRSYSTNFSGNYLEKIVVNNENLSNPEKSALLDRYVALSNLKSNVKQHILDNEVQVINHKNFSPESIRSFFANLDHEVVSRYIILNQLINHLNKPDEYIIKIFHQLEQTRKILLLGILCTLNPDIKEIGRTYANLCQDLEAEKLDSYRTIIDELDGGILKLTNNNGDLEVMYYHPSMKEGLIQIIKEDENGTIHRAIIKNLNLDLLDFCYFNSPTTKKNNEIGISQTDLVSLSNSIERLTTNNSLQFHQVIRIIKWFTSANSESLIKVMDKPFYLSIKKVIDNLITYLKSEDFYTRYLKETTSKWANLVGSLKSLGLVYSIEYKSLVGNYWHSLIENRKDDHDYWMLVFRVAGFVDPDIIYEKVGKNWLNDFYLKLRKSLYELGYEIFGNEFPDFPSYNSLSPQERTKTTKFQKLKSKPNRTWYPRFLICKSKIALLKDLKGNEIGHQIISRIEKEYEELLRYSDYAYNRQIFNEEQNWW